MFGDGGEVGEQKAVCFVGTENLNFGVERGDFRYAADMIEMSVCEPDGFCFQIPFFRFFHQSGDVASRIGEYGFPAFVVPHQRAVLAEQGNGYDFNM